MFRFPAILGLLVLLAASSAFAEQPAETQSNVASSSSPSQSITYETPTIAKLSRLYWKLDKFESTPDPKAYVENYLRINECQLYEDFAHNEFEWGKIKEKTYEFLQKNKRTFPTYFSFVQPLRFAEYDMDKKAFEIWEKYQLSGTRSFEVQSSDFSADMCGVQDKDLPGYPRALFVELSRPFDLKYVPMPEMAARTYIKRKTPTYESLREKQKTKDNLYESRDAYIVMKVKVFTFKNDMRTRDGYSVSKVLSVLDRYEIYEDPDLKTLLYAEDFNVEKKRSNSEMELKKQYQERLKKRMQEKQKAQTQAAEESASPAESTTKAP